MVSFAPKTVGLRCSPARIWIRAPKLVNARPAQSAILSKSLRNLQKLLLYFLLAAVDFTSVGPAPVSSVQN